MTDVDDDYEPEYDHGDPGEPEFDYQPPPASWPRHDRRVRHVEWQLRDRASRPARPATPAEQARAARRAARRPILGSPF